MGQSILLVDDEEIAHLTIGSYLNECSYQVEQTYDGQEALSSIDKGEHSIALFDVRMPGIDGMALLKHARQQRPNMSRIMMTGHGDPAMEEEARILGAAGFLIKPIRLRELDQLITDILCT
jgi:DNA-binding NtrC family response regulator